MVLGRLHGPAECLRAAADDPGGEHPRIHPGPLSRSCRKRSRPDPRSRPPRSTA
jgi:hypothetical protein